MIVHYDSNILTTLIINHINRYKNRKIKEPHILESNLSMHQVYDNMYQINLYFDLSHLVHQYLISSLEYQFVDYQQKSGKKVKLFKFINRRQPFQIKGYQLIPELLQQTGHSIPILLIKPTQVKSQLTIIYSHGNSSDISDACLFFEKLLKTITINVCIYDYTGYGISNQKQITQKTLCQDLQLVIKWLNIDENKLILWGFSLGSFPTITNAVHKLFAAIILQSPIASAASYFDQESKQYCNMDDTHYTYDFDCLDNLKNIAQIKSAIFIMHSTDDQVIPLAHALKLYSVIKVQGKSQQHLMVEVPKLKHNQMHYFLSEQKPNPLNQQLRTFIKGIANKVNHNEQSMPKKTATQLLKQCQITTKTNAKQSSQKNQQISPIALSQGKVEKGSNNESKNHQTYFTMKKQQKQKETNPTKQKFNVLKDNLTKLKQKVG